MPLSVVDWARASEITHGISGDDDNRSVVYRATLSAAVAGPNDDEADRVIRTYAYANASQEWDGLLLGSIGLEQLTPKIFRVTIQYSMPDGKSLQRKKGTIRWTFNVSTENRKVKAAISQRKFPSTAPDYQNFIQVTPNDDKLTVEGADWPFPTQEFGITMTNDHVFFTPEYIRRVKLYVTKLNDRPFFSHPIGCVMFVGLSGSWESSGSSELTFNFIARNKPDISNPISGITIPSGEVVWGWDFVWTKEGPEATTADQLGLAAEGVYIARIGKTADFRWFGLDSTDPPTGPWVDPT